MQEPSGATTNRGFCLLADNAGTLMGVSQHATVSLEDVAAAAPQCTRWFQLYILKDRALTADILRRWVCGSR